MFFSSKCSLFHNSNVFGSCVIHILYTECAKIKKKILRQKVNKITLLHQVGISSYFVRKMHGQTTLMLLLLLNKTNIYQVYTPHCNKPSATRFDYKSHNFQMTHPVALIRTQVSVKRSQAQLFCHYNYFKRKFL